MVLKTRTLLVKQRAQATNALRAHLTEFGIIAGVEKISALVAIVRDQEDARLPKAARFGFVKSIAEQIEAFE